MDITQLGKWLLFVGLGILLLGALLLIAGKIGLHFGKLPGDIAIQKEKFSLHFPLATCIIASILLTLLLNLLIWLFRK
jgi:uncharacterized protein HemY